MKPALLNSIYVKLSSETPDKLNGVIENYLRKVNVLYLSLLDKTGVSSLDTNIKVKITFPDGYVLNNVYKAGHHLIEALFEDDETKHDIQKLDETFLELCPCPNKESILNIVKAMIVEVGGESVDIDEWLEFVSRFNDCSHFEEEMID